MQSHTRARLANVNAQTAKLQKQYAAQVAAAQAEQPPRHAAAAAARASQASQQASEQVNQQAGGLAINSGGDGPGAGGRSVRGRGDDRRRQRDRDPALHLGRRPRLVPVARLRLLGLGQLRAQRGRACSARPKSPAGSSPTAMPAPVSGSRSTPTPATCGWTIAGWRFDTVALAEDGTRWSQGGGEYAGFVVRHPVGF